MKVNKQIIVTEEIDVKFTGITLLSEEEYLNNKGIIPHAPEEWWLRSTSPGGFQHDVGCVLHDNSTGITYVCSEMTYVRPALYIYNSQSSNLSRGDKFELVGHTWTVLSDDLALCDDAVGKTRFREDWRADDANDYDKSDIKKWLHDWAENNGIEFCDAVGESKK